MRRGSRVDQGRISAFALYGGKLVDPQVRLRYLYRRRASRLPEIQVFQKYQQMNKRSLRLY